VFATQLAVADIKRALSNALQGSSVRDLPDGVVGVLDEQPAFAVVARRSTNKIAAMLGDAGKHGGVQVAVFDEGDHREIHLVALATSVARYVVSGGSIEQFHLSTSKKMAADISAALRSADPRLRQIS